MAERSRNTQFQRDNSFHLSLGILCIGDFLALNGNAENIGFIEYLLIFLLMLLSLTASALFSLCIYEYAPQKSRSRKFIAGLLQIIQYAPAVVCILFCAISIFIAIYALHIWPPKQVASVDNESYASVYGCVVLAFLTISVFYLLFVYVFHFAVVHPSQNANGVYNVKTTLLTFHVFRWLQVLQLAILAFYVQNYSVFPFFQVVYFFLNLYIGYSFAVILSPTSWEASTPQRIRENSTIMLTQLLPDKPDHDTLALATLAMDDAIGEDILGRRGKNSTVPMIGLQERYEILLLVDFLIHVSSETDSCYNLNNNHLSACPVKTAIRRMTSSDLQCLNCCDPLSAKEELHIKIQNIVDSLP